MELTGLVPGTGEFITSAYAIADGGGWATILLLLMSILHSSLKVQWL